MSLPNVHRSRLPADPTNAELSSWEVERYELWEEAAQGAELWNRRQFVQATTGIMVVLLVRPSEAQPPTRGLFSTRSSGAAQIGAWVRLEESGQVTAYSGKVEVGQNVRTMLTQVVSEELRVPLETVQLILGDTEQCPFDAGTFGSRSAPSMVPQMRRAAAALREVLIELAAERWQTSRQTLVAENGHVIDPAAQRKIPYAELAGGHRILRAIPEDLPLRAAHEWQVQGKAVPKVNGRSIVTGQHRYTSDIQLPEMLYGKVLRPPALRATLRSVDTTRARAIPGVVVVHDGTFVGVAAATVWDAQQALAAIDVQWEVDTSLDDHDLFERLKSTASSGSSGQAFGRGRFGRGGNAGNVEQALRDADTTFEQAYRVAYIAHAPLEPRAAVAQWDQDRLMVWTGTQRPFGVRDELARQFNLPADKVRVIVPDTGSGYGGKHSAEAAVEAARLAKAAGRPVKLVWTREEEFHWAYFRPAGWIEIRSGVMRDGRLVAWECHNYNSGESALATPYDVPNRRVEFHRSNAPLRQGSYRALAATANTFARETHMDELAAALGIDPVTFRLKNLLDPRLRAVLTAAADAFGWGKTPDAGRGYGVACGTEKGSYVATCVEVEVDRDEQRVRVVRAVTAFECGAILNPDQLRNQVEGALVMGLGGALYEEIRFEQGRIINGKFSAYRVPRFRDIPSTDVVLIDRKDLPSAGAGETPIIAIAPAIGNAMFAACGIRIRSLPLLGEEWKAATRA